MTIPRAIAPTAPIALTAALLLAFSLAPGDAQAQQTFRCKNAAGQTTYSDRPCEAAPLAQPAAAKTGNQADNKPEGGKLTAASVEKVLRHALALARQRDYRAQCALAAPDIAFQIIDHTSEPKATQSGGRDQICALQRKGAQTLESAGISMATQPGKFRIDVSPDGLQATARYSELTTFTDTDGDTMRMACDREETLRVYGEAILFQKVRAECRPR